MSENDHSIRLSADFFDNLSRTTKPRGLILEEVARPVKVARWMRERCWHAPLMLTYMVGSRPAGLHERLFRRWSHAHDALVRTQWKRGSITVKGSFPASPGEETSRGA